MSDNFIEKKIAPIQFIYKSFILLYSMSKIETYEIGYVLSLWISKIKIDKIIEKPFFQHFILNLFYVKISLNYGLLFEPLKIMYLWDSNKNLQEFEILIVKFLVRKKIICIIDTHNHARATTHTHTHLHIYTCVRLREDVSV